MKELEPDNDKPTKRIITDEEFHAKLLKLKEESKQCRVLHINRPQIMREFNL